MACVKCRLPCLCVFIHDFCLVLFYGRAVFCCFVLLGYCTDALLPPVALCGFCSVLKNVRFCYPCCLYGILLSSFCELNLSITNMSLYKFQN